MRTTTLTNRKWFKNLKFILFSAILLALSLFCALHDFSNDTKGSNIVAHPIGWLGIIFFGYALIFMLYKNIKYALKGRGMVEITEEGLINRDDFIPWSSIESVYGNKYYIIFDTNDAKERLEKASWLTKINNKFDGASVRISNWDYDGSQEEFINKCLPYIEKKQQS